MTTTDQSSPSQTVNQPSKPHWLVRLLFHPMLYLAVIIHGLALAIPGGPEDELPPEVEEEQEIEITMLPAIIEPDPDIPVEELPEEPPPPPPPTDPIAPPPEPIQEQEPPPIPESEPEPENEGEGNDQGEGESEGDEQGEDGGEGDEQGEEEGTGDTSADVSQVADQIAAIVAKVNQSRDPTVQIDSMEAPQFPNQYKQPDNYFANGSVSQDAIFSPGIILATSDTGNTIPVNLDDTRADEFVNNELIPVLAQVYQVDIVSEKLPGSRGVQQIDDYLLKLSDPNNPDNVAFYLAIARMQGGSVTLFPWISDSFPEEG